MAEGRSIGTIFAELDLDPSRYTKAQQQLYKDATQTALGIEENFKKLGIKSSAEFDLMRQKAVNSFEAILHSSKATANDIVRAEQAKADTIKRINEQQYGHQTTLIEGLKKNWLAATAAIYAAQAAIQKGIALMDEGAKALQVESSFKIMADAAGVSSEKMIASMKAATKETIDDSDMMQKAVKLMTLGYNPEQIERFSKVVITASQIAGVTAAEAYDGLADAIANRMPKALVKMGAITKEQMKVVTEAITAGADSTVLYELAMANLELKQRMLQGTQDGATLSMQKFHAQINETKEAIGKGLIVVTQKLYGVLQAVSAAALGTSGALFSLISHLPGTDKASWQAGAKAAYGAAGELAEKSYGNMYGTAEAQAKASKTSIDSAQKEINAQMAKLEAIAKNKKASEDAAKTTEAATKQAAEATRKATYEIDSVGLSQYQKDLDRIKAEADKYRKAGVDKVTVAKYVAAETELALRKSFVVQTEENKKMYEEMQKGAEEYRKMVSAEQSFSVSKHEKAMLEIIANEDNKLRAAEKLMDEGKISWDEYQAYLLLVQQNAAIATQELIQKELSDYADFYSQITGYEEEYRDNKLKWIDKEQKRLAELYKDDVAAAKWAADQKGKLEYDLFKKKTDYIADGFGNLSSAFDGISKLYAEGSKDAEKWEEAAKAMEIAQRAVAVVQAVAAIATQGLGDPYTAFARVAAMAATMGALLASIGESVSGSSASVAATSQRTSSTALGSEEASASISNSLEILQDTYDIENTRLTQIYNEMRDLNNNITGLVTSLVRTGGISDLNIETGTTLGSVENFLNQQINSDAFKYLFAADFLGVTEDVSRFVNGLIGDVFGGETETSITEAGIKFGKTLVENLLNGAGVSAKQYTTVLTEEEGGWFGSDSTTIQDYYTALDDSVTRMITLVYKGISSNLVYIAQELGGDVADVYNYVFKSKKLDLKDMTTDEMNTAINEYFSTISDNAVESLFGDLISQYQELNEGLMETAIRLISDKQTIASILELTNQTFNSTTSQFIKFSEALIDVAGSLDDLTDAFSTYYDAFFTDAEKQADYKKQLSGVMGSYGYSLPTSRTGYRDIVESLDLTTDAGMSAYYALLAVSETADKYYDYIENAAASISESQYATKVEYLRAVRGYADGGVASGLAWVGENGKELAYFDQPTKIYSNSESGKIVSQGELIAEVRALREDLQAQNGSIATYNYKMTKYLQFLEQWDAGGIPTERAA